MGDVNFSDNPARVARDLLRNPDYKRAMCRRLGIPEDTEIDEASFEERAKYFDEPVDFDRATKRIVESSEGK